MDVDEALTAIVTRLREDPDRYAMHGYHVYLRPIWEEHIAEREGLDLHANRSAVASHGLDVSGVFYAAAWELCRRGILRPGIKSNMEQVTEDGQGGNGYSYTPMGRRWLEAVEQYDYIPTEPSRLAEMLAPFGQRFGPGFHQRAQEAVGCYLGTMYLACCVMCGGAAESILLALAVAKMGDEKMVLRKYKGRDGTRQVQKIVLGEAAPYVKQRFTAFTDLISYWRNEAAHGIATDIGEYEAYEALGRLLRFAHYAGDSWDDLTAP